MWQLPLELSPLLVAFMFTAQIKVTGRTQWEGLTRHREGLQIQPLAPIRA
jgi:hypothetical protein